MPHLAEEGWSLLGYNTLIANESWPEVDRSLLIDDTVTIAVQVNGKRRDEIVVPAMPGGRTWRLRRFVWKALNARWTGGR